MLKLTFLLLLLPFLSDAQVDIAGNGFPFKDGKVVYEYTVDVPGIKKNDIYNVSKKWIADHFTAGETIVHTDDTYNASITGSTVKLVSLDPGNGALQSDTFELYFSINMLCKDGRYQIFFSDISTKSVALGSMTSDVKVPVEMLAHSMKNTKFKPQQMERNRNMKKAIDDQFARLQDSLYHNITKSAGSLF